MKKIIVIGCPGSGKSVFSRALHNKTGIPLYHLDMMYWNLDKSIVEKSVFLQHLLSAMENDEWIIDGNYSSTMYLRASVCDTIVFLDYPVDVCLDGIKSRCGKARDDMPWIETEEDKELVEFVKNFNREQRPQILDMIREYTDKRTFVFTSREQGDAFLDKFSLIDLYKFL